jgi:uncharacterized protein (TIGR03435 family)
MRATALVAVFCGLAWGQAKFEAADVHVSAPGTVEMGGFLPNGRAEFHAVPLLQLISMAYSVPADRIAGGPPWLATDLFDIVAKAPGKASSAQMLPMLQSLLEERFGLTVKRENKPLPVYALTIKKAGVLKASAKEGEPDCQRGQEEFMLRAVCRNVTMASLAERLPSFARAYFDKPVVDRTQLPGDFDFTLEWLGRARATGAQSGMSMYNALEKQLGLKVEEQTEPMPVLTIERVNRTPTPNADGVTEKLGAPPTEFDVATIKPSRPGENPNGDFKNGVVDAKALTLKELISFAYNVEEEGVKGGEKWLETDRFDILAKTQLTLSGNALMGMLQKLLEERFKLKVHREEQPVAVYALTAPKAKLKEADPAGRSACKITFPDGVRTLVCTNTTMAQFAERVRNFAAAYFEHPVVDLTGLKGSYDFSVSWVARQLLTGASAPPSTDGVASDRPTGQTVFEAVDKQLGLKLTSQKHPMPVIVVDHADRKPAEN